MRDQMLTEPEARALMVEFIALRTEADSGKVEAIKAFKKHETKCINSFTYLITMHTNRYKAFANHEDLIQEGYEALLKGMKNYNPKKGGVFGWFHHYIGTRVSRQANLHTTIRFPLKVAKAQVPKREYDLPLQIEETFCPDKQTEASEVVDIIRKAVRSLRGRKKAVVSHYFGFNSENQMYSINKICEILKLSRPKCLTILEDALADLKFVIRL
jgi:RNA polymerase sigma factor (sigma-70 family)